MIGDEHLENDVFAMTDLDILWEDIDDQINISSEENDVAKLSVKAGVAISIDSAMDTMHTFSVTSLGSESVSDQCVHEGVYTMIHCLRDSGNKFSSRTGLVAIKTLRDEFSARDEASRLRNEYTISRHEFLPFENTLFKDIDDQINISSEENDVAKLSVKAGLAISIDSAMDTMHTFSVISLGSESVSGQCVHEGVYTMIHCLRDSGNKFSSRTGLVAIKTLRDEFSARDEASRLQNEYTISRHLSQCSAVRSAFLQRDINGLPAIVLEWVNGTSLNEWIGWLHTQIRLPFLDNSRSDTKIVLRVAQNITEALSKIHDAGVIHNNLAPENIIVDNNSDSDDLGVKVIGLGSAYLWKDSTQGKRKDLISLGSVFFEMFTGKCPFKRSYGHSTLGGKKDDEVSNSFLSQNQLISILTARVPLAIAKFTLGLMEIERYTDTRHNQSAKDVGHELRLMIQGLESSVYCSANTQVTSLGRLYIHKDKLYGRDYHVSKLMDACSRIGTSDQLKIVLISGYSGAGKSAIVRHVKRNFDGTNNTSFICGKFDQLQQVEPLSALNAALSEYSTSIIKKGLETINETKRAIIDAINTDIGVLTEAFPCLCKIVGEPITIPTEVDSMAAQHRFKFIFRLFVRAIATPSNPIILFLDDLQWADELSLQLVDTLVSDREISGLLFVGCYRDNEVNADHPLASLWNELERKKIAITSINVASIPKKDVNVMVSDSICMPQQLTESLSAIIYRKTSGNALFVNQLLQSLWDEGLLLFSLESNTWQWSTEDIDAKNVADDVGVLMSANILQLPYECQYALMLFACVGSRCDEAILRLFMGKDKDSEAAGSKYDFPMLDLATNEGLLKKNGPFYLFAHDQVQHAAYSLIPENERHHLHKKIGYLILEHAPDDKVDNILFIAVEQLNRGKMSIKDEGKQIELARLNLRAAEKTILLTTFSSSVSYLEAGIGMLSYCHWKKHYDLSLQLYSLCAEAEYCMGRFQEVGRIAGIVITEAVSFKDKLRVYATLIKALGAQAKPQEAINIGFSVLQEMGIQCQCSLADKAFIVIDLMTTKKAFEDLTVAQFLDIKEMSDTNIITAMKFLNLILFCSFRVKEEYLHCITTKMMRLTLSYGVCKESCAVLGYCSFLLVALKDFKAAEYIGHFAFLLLERLKAEEYKPLLQFAIHGCVLSWIKHTKLSLGPLMHGYKAGVQKGDILYAMGNICLYISNSFVSGQNLVELAKDIEVFGKQLVEYKHITCSASIIPVKQAVTDLISCTDNSSLLFCQTTEYRNMLEQAFGKKQYMRVSDFYNWGGIVAYIYGEYDLAADLVQKRKKLEELMSRRGLLIGMADFFDGLIFLAMAYKSTNKCDSLKWRSLASNTVLDLETFAKIGKPNFESKLLLLQAETKKNTGEKEDALEKYIMAIAAAEKNDLLHVQAIATKRLADFLLKNSDQSASHYYGKALSLYQQWGAQRKVDHLSKNIPF